MIIEKKVATSVMTEEIQSNAVGVKADSVGFLVNLMSSKLYSDGRGSFLREILSNAIDSNFEAKQDNPVLVRFYIDSSDEINIVVRDYGVGLSPERFNDIYLNIASSTKKTDNGQQGGFGIGRFASLSYSNYAAITSFYNGTRYDYAMYHDGDSTDIPKLQEVPTDEPNGVSVTISFGNLKEECFDRETELLSVFLELLTKLSYFKNIFVDVDFTEDEYNNCLFVHEGINIPILGSVMGRVPQFKVLADKINNNVILETKHYVLSRNILKNGTNFASVEHVEDFKSLTSHHRSDRYESRLHIAVGGVVFYPVDPLQLVKYFPEFREEAVHAFFAKTKCQKKRDLFFTYLQNVDIAHPCFNLPLGIKVDIGVLDIPPSRESFIYNKKTCIFLLNKIFIEVLPVFEQKILQENLKNFETAQECLDYYEDLNSYDVIGDYPCFGAKDFILHKDEKERILFTVPYTRPTSTSLSQGKKDIQVFYTVNSLYYKKGKEYYGRFINKRISSRYSKTFASEMDFVGGKSINLDFYQRIFELQKRLKKGIDYQQTHADKAFHISEIFSSEIPVSVLERNMFKSRNLRLSYGGDYFNIPGICRTHKDTGATFLEKYPKIRFILGPDPKSINPKAKKYLKHRVDEECKLDYSGNPEDTSVYIFEGFKETSIIVRDLLKKVRNSMLSVLPTLSRPIYPSLDEMFEYKLVKLRYNKLKTKMDKKKEEVLASWGKKLKELEEKLDKQAVERLVLKYAQTDDSIVPIRTGSDFSSYEISKTWDKEDRDKMDALTEERDEDVKKQLTEFFFSLPIKEQDNIFTKRGTPKKETEEKRVEALSYALKNPFFPLTTIKEETRKFVLKDPSLFSISDAEELYIEKFGEFATQNIEEFKALIPDLRDLEPDAEYLKEEAEEVANRGLMFKNTINVESTVMNFLYEDSGKSRSNRKTDFCDLEVKKFTSEEFEENVDLNIKKRKGKKSHNKFKDVIFVMAESNNEALHNAFCYFNPGHNKYKDLGERVTSCKNWNNIVFVEIAKTKQKNFAHFNNFIHIEDFMENLKKHRILRKINTSLKILEQHPDIRIIAQILEKNHTMFRADLVMAALALNKFVETHGAHIGTTGAEGKRESTPQYLKFKEEMLERAEKENLFDPAMMSLLEEFKTELQACKIVLPFSQGELKQNFLNRNESPVGYDRYGSDYDTGRIHKSVAHLLVKVLKSCTPIIPHYKACNKSVHFINNY